MISENDIEVELLDFMGSDLDIDKAARISYGKMDSERTPAQIKGLLRYLLWHRHTSPFEMVEFKFLINMPIFVARQMVRHRTASLNEISRRYTDVDISFYNFELRQVDLSVTKQGSGKPIPTDSPFYFKIKDLQRQAIDLFQEMVNNDISKETARLVMPVNTMTKWVWKIDLHNLFHFLNLRWDSHAQYEIQIVAKKIIDLVEPIVPISMMAFKDWKLMMASIQEIGYDYFKKEKIDEFTALMKKIKPK